MQASRSLKLPTRTRHYRYSRAAATSGWCLRIFTCRGPLTVSNLLMPSAIAGRRFIFHTRTAGAFVTFSHTVNFYRTPAGHPFAMGNIRCRYSFQARWKATGMPANARSLPLTVLHRHVANRRDKLAQSQATGLIKAHENSLPADFTSQDWAHHSRLLVDNAVQRLFSSRRQFLLAPAGIREVPQIHHNRHRRLQRTGLV